MKEKQNSLWQRLLLIIIDIIPGALKSTLCLSLLLGFGFPTLTSAQRISVVLHQAKVKKVLTTLTQQTGLSLAYSKQVVDLERKVNMDFKDAELTTILDALVAGTSLGYEIKNGKIYLFEKPGTKKESGQTKKITGIVTDSKGEPVIGANVIEKGTTHGTITDIDGRFVLEVSDTALLQISYIGFSPATFSTVGQTTLAIRLKEDSQALDEVVVVGYGTQKKVNLTGSVSSVRFDEELANRPITDASQALSGKVSGIWISQNSGKPGDDGAQLRVRGWGTLNNSDPLVIIDGVEGVFSQITPNDIESITVLKDAASAAIYGSKAANGVILVTTKMGNTNEKIQINLNSYAGIQAIGQHYNLISNSADFMSITNQALLNGGGKNLFPQDMIAAFANGKDPYKYPNTDWYDYLYRAAFLHEHNLSIRGGTEKMSSFLSLNYLDQDGIILHTHSKRFGARANLEYTVNSWLKMGGRLNYTHKVSSEPYKINRVFEMHTGAAPFIAPYTRDGRFGSVEAIDKEGVLLYENYNPLIDASNGETKVTQDYMALNAFATVQFTPNLDLKITWASNGSWKMTDCYNQTIYGYTDSGMETITKNYNSGGLEMNREQKTSVRNNFHATLNYSHTFRDKHFTSGVVGYQLENYNLKNVFSRRTDPPKEGLTQVDAGTGGIKGEGNMEGLRMVSYFGRLNYAFSDKYLFEMNLRADASSRFRRGNRWGVFPGVSAGWRLSEEKFIQNLNLFSNLKLRASWGQLGNQTIEGYWPYLTVINQNYNLSYNYGGTLAPGAAVTALVDQNITWETTATFDLGIDLGFLGNRLTAEFDYFDKKTTDIIVQLPIPLMLGDLTAPFENVGEMKNRGFEAVINYDNGMTDRDRFGFNIGLNFTYIHNKVTKFQAGNSPDQLYLIREGASYKSLYGYKAVGIYQSDEEAKEHMYANGYIPEAGNLKYEDMNNDGKLDYRDKQVLGNTIPKITYGITAGVRYKGLDLNLLFQGLGQANAYTQNYFTILRYSHLTIADYWKDAWTPEHTDTQIPMLRFDSSWDIYDSSFWVHRIDFLKLKNLQLGYTIPESITSRFKIQKLYIYANAQNVFTLMWKKGYEGYDPERNTFDDGSRSYPNPKIFSFGINFNF